MLPDPKLMTLYGGICFKPEWPLAGSLNDANVKGVRYGAPKVALTFR